MKVYALPAEETWICDQLVKDWNDYCSHIATENINEADIIWLISDWRWKNVNITLLKNKKIVCTVHHIVPSKFNDIARLDFQERDQYVDVYHVYNIRTKAQLELLTNKPIVNIPYWVNDNIWKFTNKREEIRKKYNIPLDAYVIFSAQRDTEGHDLKSPKKEKGPENLVNFLIQKYNSIENCYILLAGWRRQFVKTKLNDAKVKYHYVELPSQSVINEFYQCANLYPVASLHEGGPQSLLEAGALQLPVVSTPVGIAEDVLPYTAINENIFLATPCIPDIQRFKINNGGMQPYENFFQKVYNGTIK